MDLDEFRDRLDVARSDIAALILLGQGHDGMVASIGPAAELVGRTLSEIELERVDGDVEIEGADSDNVIDTSGYPPAVIVAKVSTHDAKPPSEYALVVDDRILSTATPVESSDREAVIRFFVDPDMVVAANGRVEVVGITDRDGTSYRLVRFS